MPTDEERIRMYRFYDYLLENESDAWIYLGFANDVKPFKWRETITKMYDDFTKQGIAVLERIEQSKKRDD